jgi:TRAP-type mannitol/chloroaromatic compound transport system permease small subunit
MRVSAHLKPKRGIEKFETMAGLLLSWLCLHACMASCMWIRRLCRRSGLPFDSTLMLIYI